ncbi:hypothetical protein EYB26_000768 [Talaromyces marneffei]|uniref:Uncharacterized protein C7orf50 like n=1 Tax=Talaromyces marneffei PM1 TaxID=1077442 RepID=A0A093VDN3_TALMA|nr:uncharacterized protein EYB26_000768 [Talaromyces marneffei]QGA13123.1 hypothetical protein EYB26_000768 [Talaromyces marneffei]
MSVESKHALGASELKAKKKDEKRKLKEAKKDTDTIQDADDLVKDKSERKPKKKSKKRSRDDDDANEEKQHHEEEKGNNAEEDAGTEIRSRKKRKSVSFADKVDIQTIENKDEINGATGKDTKTDDHDDENTADNEKQSRERRKKEKREKREQRRKDGETSTTTSEGDKSTTDSVDKSIIAYLSQYYHDRASWKFQKIREAQLLKHVFSLEHVPSEYNPALLAYLKGLKSEGARTRLRKGAQDVIKFDEKHTTASSEGDEITSTEETKGIAKLPALPDSWREQYGDAVYRFKGNLNGGVKDLNEGVTLTAPAGDDNENGEVDANVWTRLEYRKRAEMVLWTVSGRIGKYSSATSKQEKSAETESEPTEAAASNMKKEAKQKAPARKKRKNRTMIVDISSSSESSDSDSD